MQNELFRYVVFLAGHWSLTGQFTHATAMPCNKCDDRVIDDSDDGAEVVFSWRMSGSRQVIDGVHDVFDDCVRIA